MNKKQRNRIAESIGRSPLFFNSLLSINSLLFFNSLPPFVVCCAVAAEIRLKEKCSPAGPQVVLADVADIYSAEPSEVEALGSVELMRAPVSGLLQTVEARRVLDALRARGVNLAQHRFSGASQVAIGSEQVAPDKRGAVVASEPAGERVREVVREAIARRLVEATGRSNEAWNVQVNLSGAQVRQLAAVRAPLAAEGGAAPWEGQQRFVVRWQAGGRQMRVPVQARVAAGHALDQASVEGPLWVRRGDEVTVYARTAGIQARTIARARQDGRQGELVQVESLGDRTKYFARVTGVREVDVYAGSPRAE